MKTNKSNHGKTNYYYKLANALHMGNEFFEVRLMHIQNNDETFLCLSLKDENPCVAVFGSIDAINSILCAYTDLEGTLIAVDEKSVVTGEVLKSFWLQYLKRFFEVNKTSSEMQSQVLTLLVKGHMMAVTRNKGQVITIAPRSVMEPAA